MSTKQFLLDQVSTKLREKNFIVREYDIKDKAYKNYTFSSIQSKNKYGENHYDVKVLEKEDSISVWGNKLLTEFYGEEHALKVTLKGKKLSEAEISAMESATGIQYEYSEAGSTEYIYHESLLSRQQTIDSILGGGKFTKFPISKITTLLLGFGEDNRLYSSSEVYSLE